MSITFACPVCKSAYTVNDRDAGKKADCKQCGQRLQVPAPERLRTVLGEAVPSAGGLGPTPPPMPARPRHVEPEPDLPPPRRDRYAPRRSERLPLYGNEESVRFRSDLSPERLEQVVEDAIGRLGYVQFFGGGDFDVTAGRFRSFATDVRMAGTLSRGRRDDEWVLSLSYSVQPSPACWVIAILGFLFFLVGPLVFLIPFTAKGNVQRAVERAVREVRDEAEGFGERGH